MENESERDEQPVPSAERSGGFGLGLFLGALVGAAVALLFAPGPGRDTRRRLRGGLTSARDRLGQEFDDIDAKVREEFRRRRG